LVLQIFALKVRIVLHRQFFVWARIRFDQMAAAWAVLAATLLAARVALAAPVVGETCCASHSPSLLEIS
jgi:hypothetical protein